MSLKTLFEKQKQSIIPWKAVELNTIEDFSLDAESADYITEYQKSIDSYLQDVNFATASNFAKFGSARKYYENITNRITNYFPFDGSKADQLKFQNELNPFEKYIYLFQFPRTTGFIEFGRSWAETGIINSGFGSSNSPEYISFHNQNVTNVYDPDNGLKENTRFNFIIGSTIEFWLKKNSFATPATQTSKEVIYYTATTGSDDKDKRIAVYVSGGSNNTSSIYTEYYSGVNTQQFSFGFDTGLQTIADSKWHHYAISYYSSSYGYTSDFYFDGAYKTTKTQSGPIIDLTGSSFNTIGSLGGKLNSATNLLGYGKLSGSVDEFRFWNVKRDAKQIGLNYFVNVGGGNNTKNNSNIGIYYKFNEGITGGTSVDSVILDSAGRNCNGTLVGYSASSSRNMGSAITLTQDKPEVATPILYIDHPTVQEFLISNLVLADEYDFTNNFAIKNSMPSWILDDDEKNGDILTNFLQTLASYLDTLFIQITTFKGLKDKSYLNFKGKAPPFSDLLLTSNGFDLPSLFLNTDIVQSILGQDNKRTYEESINNLKNVIYKNIYNNLDILYKSKGTENSIKQLIKNFGVDENVYSLNIYGNNTQYKLTDCYVNKSIKKDYIDFTPFSSPVNATAVIYQSGTVSFITGSTDYTKKFTAECDFIIPEFPPSYDKLAYNTLTYNTSSVFGIGTATNNPAEITISGSNPAGLEAKLIFRDDKGYFSLTCQASNVILTSSVFSDITTNQHWNLSAKLTPVYSGGNYNLIFSGYSNFVSDQFREFSVSSSLTNVQGNKILSNNKRIYVGSQRTNITGSVLSPSIIKALSVRYWEDELSTDELKGHSRNPKNFGRESPSEPFSLSTGSYVSKIDKLKLHWDFTNVTSSDSDGNVNLVYDLTSGSYNGSGYGFKENSTIKHKELVYSSEQQVPENLYSSQLIDILSTDDEYYTSTVRPQSFFFSLENSMYAIISKNILNMFSSAIEFNNFIGEPMNTYKSQYSKLKSFRKIFFSKVQNQPDLDKYVGVYKWIDDALDSILFNLLPASANASEKVRTIIESHILERSKINYPLIPDKSVKPTGGNKAVIGSENDMKPPPGYGIIIQNDIIIIQKHSRAPRERVTVHKKGGTYTNNSGRLPPQGSWILDFSGPLIALDPTVPPDPIGPISYQESSIAVRIGRRP